MRKRSRSSKRWPGTLSSSWSTGSSRSMTTRFEFINRGHDYACFQNAVALTAGRGIHVGAHLILGFPTETREQMLAMADETFASAHRVPQDPSAPGGEGHGAGGALMPRSRFRPSGTRNTSKCWPISSSGCRRISCCSGCSRRLPMRSSIAPSGTRRGANCCATSMHSWNSGTAVRGRARL